VLNENLLVFLIAVLSFGLFISIYIGYKLNKASGRLMKTNKELTAKLDAIYAAVNKAASK